MSREKVFESPRAGLLSPFRPTAESTVPASSGAVRRLVLVRAESHGRRAAIQAATEEDPPNPPQPSLMRDLQYEPVASGHDFESPSESDTERESGEGWLVPSGRGSSARAR